MWGGWTNANLVASVPSEASLCLKEVRLPKKKPPSAKQTNVVNLEKVGISFAEFFCCCFLSFKWKMPAGFEENGC